MTHFVPGIRICFALIVIVCSVPNGYAEELASIARSDQVRISYESPSDEKYRPIYGALKRREVLERLQRFLVPLRLPTVLTVKLEQCGAETKPYESGGSVAICYELVQRIIDVTTQNTKDANEQTLIIDGTFVEAVLHEIAHAVFDLLQVPIWGREDDAADRVAALTMMQFSDQVAFTTIVGTAKFFEYSKRIWTGVDFAQLGSPEAQRFYNYLCIAYGGDPRTFHFLAPRPGPTKIARLSEARAPRCQREYQQVQHAFDLRIMPFVDPQLLVTVRASQWLLPDEIPGGEMSHKDVAKRRHTILGWPRSGQRDGSRDAGCGANVGIDSSQSQSYIEYRAPASPRRKALKASMSY